MFQNFFILHGVDFHPYNFQFFQTYNFKFMSLQFILTSNYFIFPGINFEMINLIKNKIEKFLSNKIQYSSLFVQERIDLP